MPLIVGGNSGNPNSTEFPGGIFVNQATIVAIEDISGEQLLYMKTPCDVGIRITIDVGRDFQPTLNITGNVKRDGEKTDWGQAWIVRAFFDKLGIAGHIEEENGRFHIPAEMLTECVGKQFLKLSYCAGMKEKDPTKVRFSEWYEIATVEEGAQALHARFLKSLSKGYPKNYSASTWETRKDVAAATPAPPPASDGPQW